jgi:hypothetical protein
MRIHIDDWYWQALSRIVTYDGAHMRALWWAGYWWVRLSPSLYEKLNTDYVFIRD